MNLDAALLTVFSAEIEATDEGHAISVPEREVDLGDLQLGETYRVSIEATGEAAGVDQSAHHPTTTEGADPPVAVGETHEVEIDDVGEEGDGIARVGPGYVVFVPDAGLGDRVTIEITKAMENFAFGEVIEGEPIKG